MSSMTPGSANSSRYLDFDEYVDLKLSKTGASIKTTDILVAAAGVATMFLTYLLVFILFDQWVVPGGFGIGVRWMLLSTLLILTAAWLTWKVGIPYLKTVNRLFAAREIEAADPDLKSNLLNLVDLRAAGREINPSILRALEKNAAIQLQKIDVSQAIDHRPLMRMAYVLLAVVVLFCLYALFSPKKISNSIWRSLFPAAELGVATRTEIVKVLPGHVTVLARETVEVSADIAGEVPAKVWLHFTTADGKFRDEPLELRTDGEGPTRFKGFLRGENGQGMLQDVTYVIRAGDAVSPTYRITVNQPPSATVDRIAYKFAPYMKLESTENVGGQIDAWEGTTVTLTAHTNMPVKSAMIQFLDTPDAGPNGDEESLMVSNDGLKLTATWKLAFRSDGMFSKFYQIQCRTEADATDPRPTQYTLNIRPDQPPEVALLEPVRDMEVPANAVIPLLIEARDPDFELSHVNLHIKKNGQAISKEPLSDGRQQRLLLKHELNLERLVLKKGDVVEFWVQAFDNKQPRPNSSVTPELKLRIGDRVADNEVQQKLAEDRANRDQLMEEANREQNADARPGQQPPKETVPEEKRDKPDPDRREPMPKTEPKDDARTDPVQQGDKSGDKSGKSKQTDRNAGSPDANSADKGSDATQSGERGKPTKQSLSSDGDDDQPALKELIDQFNKSKNKDKNRGPQSEPRSDSQDHAADHQPDSKTQENGSGAKPADPGGAKPSTAQSDNKAGKVPEQKSEKKTPGNSDEPDPMTGENNSKTDSTPPKAGSSKEKQQDVDKGKQPGSETQNPSPLNSSSPDAAGPDSDNGNNAVKKEPMPDGTDGSTKPKPKVEQPGVEPGQDPKSEDHKSASQPGADGNPSQAPNTPKPSDVKPNAPKSATGEQPGAATDSPSKSPMKEGPKSDKNGTGQSEAADDSADARREKATGDEAGKAKPDRDPKADPTRSKTPGALERDPKEQPETRPNGSQANDPNNPAKTASDTKVKNPKPTGEGPEKIKLDQEPTDPMSSRPDDKKRDERPGDPNAKNEDLKGPGEDKQRSKTGSGGEAGSSKEDKAGKAGSQNSGEGSETDRGSKQPQAGKKTDKESESKQAGSGSETERGGQKEPGGSKSEAAGSKPEAGGKQPGGKQPGGNEAGGKPDGKPSGQPGGNEASDKPGAGGGKSANGGGAGGAGGDRSPGRNGTGKQGVRAPDEAPDQDGNSPVNPSAEDGEEANLEFKRQATELVLKRLQQDLERGEVDPELLEKLGWTEDQMRRFAERIGKHLQESKSSEEKPESVARRQQFEEMLKSLDLNRKGTARSGENAPQREVNQIDSHRGTVPREYRSVYEKFSRDATRQKSRSAK